MHRATVRPQASNGTIPGWPDALPGTERIPQDESAVLGEMLDADDTPSWISSGEGEVPLAIGKSLDVDDPSNWSPIAGGAVTIVSGDPFDDPLDADDEAIWIPSGDGAVPVFIGEPLDVDHPALWLPSL